MSLLVSNASGSSVSTYRKEKAPRTGPQFGQWQGNRPKMFEMPGGGFLQFDLSRLTFGDYRAMRDHYQVNASLSLLSFMMHQMDWHIECDNKKIADSIEESLRRVWSRLIRAVSQAYWAGFSPIVFEYENNKNDKRIDIGKFKDLIPEEARIHWKEVKGAPLLGGEPGASLSSTLYEYDGISQVGSSRYIPPEYTLWYTLMMENGNPYGKKLLKPAFPSWFFSILLHTFANRYYERFGEPIPIGRAPFDDDVDMGNGETANGRQLMESIINGIRSRAAVVLPDDRTQNASGKQDFDYSIEYLESQMRGADFERYMDRLDEEISLSIFTPALLLKTMDVGSYNLGVQHLQTYLWLLNALSGDLKEYLDRFVVNRLKEYNFGARAPRAEWVPKKMGRENADTMRAIAVEMVKDGKAKPDITQMGEAVGLDMTEIKQVTAPIPAPGSVDPATGKPIPVKPVPDPRGQRTDRVPNGKGPRGVDKTRATGRKIAARMGTQIGKAFTMKYWNTFDPQIGLQKQFSEALMDDGASTEFAYEATEMVYANLKSWFADMTTVDQDAFTAREIVGYFTKLLESQIDDLCER